MFLFHDPSSPAAHHKGVGEDLAHRRQLLLRRSAGLVFADAIFITVFAVGRILLSLPVATLGAYLGIWVTGLENDIYFQIGLVTLIGLAAKNAILIVEFALERRRMGMSITWAAVLGAAARLRPILMTSLAMVVGLLPMMFAFGVGAHGNRTLGTAAIGGMFIGMIFQIFIVPVLFVVFQYLQEKFKPIEWEDLDNSDMSTEIEQYAKIK